MQKGACASYNLVCQAGRNAANAMPAARRAEEECVLNKTVLISGGSRGIGAATARLLSQKGYRTAILYRQSEAQARAVAAETGALALKCDVSDREAAFAAAREVTRQLGHIDALVNNAGIAQFSLFTDITEQAWQRMMAVNVGGAFHLTQAVIGGMISRKSGAIVNVSSVWGLTGASCEVHYSTAKAALIGFTKALAKEVGPSNVRVNCVAPGVIDTGMNAALSEEDRAALIDQTPLLSIGSARDAADAIAFLLSDEARFITGQVLSPNGGLVI